MNKKVFAFSVLLLVKSGCVVSGTVDDVQRELSKNFNLDIELLSWLVLNHSGSKSMSKKHWDHQGGLPWQIKELENKGYLYLIVYEFNHGEPGVGYLTMPSPKAQPILKTLQDPKIVDQKTNIEWLKDAKSRKETIYVTNHEA